MPRLQYSGAIYHLVTRGDGRRTLFHDDGHYARFTQGLSDEVDRSGWIVLAFCWMPNHVHALIKTLVMAATLWPIRQRLIPIAVSAATPVKVCDWIGSPTMNTIGIGRDATAAKIRRRRIAGS